MALDWEVDHPKRLIAATLHKDTTELEIYEFLGEVIAQGAMPYGKIIDASSGPRIAVSKVGPVAATMKLYERMGLGPIGPLALIVANGETSALAKNYVSL